MTQSPHILLKGRVLSGLRAKDHLRTPGGRLPVRLRPKERVVRQRSGLAATKEWRPGRGRATRLPTEERATHGARGAVRGYV